MQRAEPSIAQRGQEPAVVTLPAPTGAAGEVAAIALGGGDLYVFNPTAGSIRVYSGTNSLFEETPTEYFEGASVPDLAQVVDIAVNGLDLYLLGGDGWSQIVFRAVCPAAQ